MRLQPPENPPCVSTPALNESITSGRTDLNDSRAQGGAPMSTAKRVSRGFHRLAVFLAAIPLLLGGSLSVYIAFGLANRLWEQH